MKIKIYFPRKIYPYFYEIVIPTLKRFARYFIFLFYPLNFLPNEFMFKSNNFIDFKFSSVKNLFEYLISFTGKLN